MAKKLVGPNDFLVETVQGLAHPGLLLVSRDARRRPNAMTIGWGSIGIYWGKPVFVVPVRESRYTYQCIEKTGDFTVNLLPRKLAHVAEYCGTLSGRDHDKLAECRLTAVDGGQVKSPIIDECVLCYECKVVHVNDVVPAALTREISRSCYPKGDYHRLYFGEILAVHADPHLRRKL